MVEFHSFRIKMAAQTTTIPSPIIVEYKLEQHRTITFQTNFLYQNSSLFMYAKFYG